MIARGILRGGLVGAVLSVVSGAGRDPYLRLRGVAATDGGLDAGRLPGWTHAVRGGARQGGSLLAPGGRDRRGARWPGQHCPCSHPLQPGWRRGISLYLLPEGVVKAFSNLGINLMAMNTLGGSLFLAGMMCGVLWLVSGVVERWGERSRRRLTIRVPGSAEDTKTAEEGGQQETRRALALA